MCSKSIFVPLVCKYSPFQTFDIQCFFFTITKEKVVLEIIEAVNKAAETKKRQYTMNTNIAK